MSRWSIASFYNNAMFLKHFKPWMEIIRAKFFITIFHQTVKGRIVHVHRKEKRLVEQIFGKLEFLTFYLIRLSCMQVLILCTT